MSKVKITKIKKSKQQIVFLTGSFMLVIFVLLGSLISMCCILNNFEAIKNSDITTENKLGNGRDLFSGFDSVNESVFKDLYTKMSTGKNTDYFNYSGADIKSKGLVLLMAGKQWQVVYRSNDYVTLLLNDVISTSKFQSGTPYESYAALTSSQPIRSSLLNIYNEIFGSYKEISDSIIATPYDLHFDGVTWQSNQAEINWKNNTWLTKNSSLGNSDDKSTSAYDKLWLPSGPELFAGNSFNNSTSGAGGYYIIPGKWGSNKQDLLCDSSSVSEYFWLRSGFSNEPNSGCLVYQQWSAPNQETLAVNNSYGVRPALHLNLKAIANYVGYEVNITSETENHLSPTTFMIKNNEAKTVSLKLKVDNYSITSVKDQWGNRLNFNIAGGESSGSTSNYSYTSYLDISNGEILLTLSNVTNNVYFQVTTNKYYNIINNNKSFISNVGGYRASISASNASISADYLSGNTPMIIFNGFSFKLTSVSGNGNANGLSYNYVFANQHLIVNFTGLTEGIFNITLDVNPKINYKVSVTSNNSTVSTNYDNTGNAVIIVEPNAAYWANSIEIDGIIYNIEYTSKMIADSPKYLSINYLASIHTSIFRIYIISLNDNFAIKINLSTIPLTDLKDSGGTVINGVAVSTSKGGDAKIVSNDLDSDGIAVTVTVVAWVNKGYEFKGWSIDGGITYLKDESNINYGASATIPADLVKGKVITACFAPIMNNNVNTELNNL